MATTNWKLAYEELRKVNNDLARQLMELKEEYNRLSKAHLDEANRYYAKYDELKIRIRLEEDARQQDLNALVSSLRDKHNEIIRLQNLIGPTRYDQTR